jgi:hypothetical protein
MKWTRPKLMSLVTPTSYGAACSNGVAPEPTCAGGTGATSQCAGGTSASGLGCVTGTDPRPYTCGGGNKATGTCGGGNSAPIQGTSWQAGKLALINENILECVFIVKPLLDANEENRIAGAVGFSVRGNKVYIIKCNTMMVACGGAINIYQPRSVGE